jgi:hypothetical protein
MYPAEMSGEARTAAYTIFGTLLAFKLVTAIYIFFLQPTVHAAAFLTLTSVVWFGLAAIPLLIGGAFWYRMIRARRKRRLLIAQEWNVPVGGIPVRER